MKIYNFSPGPACLPKPVVEAAKRALTNYKNTGISVIELSHRSGPIMQIFDAASNRLRRLMKVPENYEILWLQGGASLQFTMVPQNLLPDDSGADFIETGLWSTKAITECNKIGHANIIASSKESNFSYIPTDFKQNYDSLYTHITSNNTIYGTQYKVFPEIRNTDSFLVADMSSDILSRHVDVSRFGIIYAGAQKNIGPAGVTVVIIRKNLIGKGYRDLPAMLDYDVHARKKSMFNTPPVFSVYVVNETLKWIDDLGGVEAVEKINARKAKKLYVEIDRNSIFRSPVPSEDRSMMNITFVFNDVNMDESAFIEFCQERGLVSLKGHRSVGGFRASLYNAMPEKGIDLLVSAMQDYEKMDFKH